MRGHLRRSCKVIHLDGAYSLLVVTATP